jgi:hypothetical protein
MELLKRLRLDAEEAREVYLAALAHFTEENL